MLALHLNLQSVVGKVNTIGKALLNFCMQTDMMHHVGKIGFTWFDVFYYFQRFKYRLMCFVRFGKTQGIYPG